jgi:hypothetical protein
VIEDLPMIEMIIPSTDSAHAQGNALCKPVWCGIVKIEGFADTEEQSQVIGQELSPPTGCQR